MGRRDEEIERLILYAKGLGVKVVVYNRKHKSNIHAMWSIDGSLIEVFIWPRTSKLEVVLSLVHEIAHHLWFVWEKNRKPDLKFEEALDRANIEHGVREDENIAPIRHRKKIYDVEAAGITYWDIIIKDTNIKIAPWRIEFQKAFDLWHFEYYYQNGSFPKRKVAQEKKKELKLKFKPGVKDVV